MNARCLAFAAKEAERVAIRTAVPLRSVRALDRLAGERPSRACPSITRRYVRAALAPFSWLDRDALRPVLLTA
jgi:hypothetical protein